MIHFYCYSQTRQRRGATFYDAMIALSTKSCVIGARRWEMCDDMHIYIFLQLMDGAERKRKILKKNFTSTLLAIALNSSRRLFYARSKTLLPFCSFLSMFFNMCHTCDSAVPSSLAEESLSSTTKSNCVLLLNFNAKIKRVGGTLSAAFARENIAIWFYWKIKTVLSTQQSDNIQNCSFKASRARFSQI